MATAGLQYNRLRLNLTCPWNLGVEPKATYSNMFVLSGAAPLADLATAEATALDLFIPIKNLSYAGAELVSWSYYAPNSHAATFQKTYPTGTHPCDGAGITSGGIGQQAEVCILAEGPTDKNTRGKQVYLRKFIHWVKADSSNPNAMQVANVTDSLAKWKNGSGPNLLVPIDTDSGVQATTWTLKTHLYTRQFRKGKKRKVAATIRYVPVPIPPDLVP